MTDAVIWGAGTRCRNFLDTDYFLRQYNILAVVANDWKSNQKVKDYVVMSPEELWSIDFSVIIICSQYVEEIQNQIIEMFKDNSIKILTYDAMYDAFKHLLENKLIEKYKNSEDNDAIKFINDVKKNGISVWGSYKKKHTKNKVFFEKDGMPYILFENKKMFYPKEKYPDIGKEYYVYDVLSEQGKDSPHLYIRDDHEMIENSIIIDAGACEGNFALRYIEKCKKMYIIESDKTWIEPLKRTFKPWENKTAIINKKLDRYTSDSKICIDDISDTIDFLKMDIEGSEVDAILGGKRTLSRSNARAAICLYHHYKDEENIGFLMKALGYKTEISSGYMFFIYDNDIDQTVDLRHGIMYCAKEK